MERSSHPLLGEQEWTGVATAAAPELEEEQHVLRKNRKMMIVIKRRMVQR